MREWPEAKWSAPTYKKYFEEQKKSRVFETLLFTPDDFLLEGNVSNVIAVINNVLITPQDRVLPGITVRQVLERATDLGLKTELRPVSRVELETATEIFVTNALKDLVPVSAWGDWRRLNTKVYDQLKDL